jgi:flagellar biosynthesis component FlhA
MHKLHAMVAQMLGIEKGNPIGVFLVLATSLAILGWWAFYWPQGKAAKALVDLREEFISWQDRETKRYDTLWEEKVELMKRCESLEGKLARLMAKHDVSEED